MLTKAMWDRAQALIAADALQAYRETNRGRKRHKPYRLPARSADLVDALGTGDVERVAAIMLYRFNEGSREPV